MVLRCRCQILSMRCITSDLDIVRCTIILRKYMLISYRPVLYAYIIQLSPGKEAKGSDPYPVGLALQSSGTYLPP